MKKIRASKAKTLPQPFARYLRAQILAHPDLVHRLRPTIRRPTVRRPTQFGK